MGNHRKNKCCFGRKKTFQIKTFCTKNCLVILYRLCIASPIRPAKKRDSGQYSPIFIGLISYYIGIIQNVFKLF
jgi:hypothetical protein